MQHPAVLEAAVVGTQDADGLIKPKAFVVLQARPAGRASDELKAFVKERLAPYKYPRWIEFIDELPKTATGKIQRFRLREREAQRMSRAPHERGRRRVRRHRRLARPRAAHRIRMGRRERRDAPLVVFLHEGLGSLAMWKDFPRACARPRGCAAWCSRATATAAPRRAPPTSAGRPTSCTPGARGAAGAARRARHRRRALALRPQRRRLDRAALRGALPDARRRRRRRWRRTSSSRTCRSRASSRRARPTSSTDLRERLARYHDDPDSAFWGWNDIWLAPAVPRLEHRAETRRHPLPGAGRQGVDDEYGTLAQIRGIAAPRAANAACSSSPNCGHSPHRDQPEARDRATAGSLHSRPTSIQLGDTVKTPHASPTRLMPPLAAAAAPLRRSRRTRQATRQAQGRPDAALHRHLRRAGRRRSRTASSSTSTSTAASSAAARSSTSRSTTSPIRPRPPTTSTS